MNKVFLEEVLKIREQEIMDGKHLGTAQPIYVVLSLTPHYVSGHTDYLGGETNNIGKSPEYGYIDSALDSECIEFKSTEDDMESSEAVTRFWSDKVVAFFLTSEAAHDYLKYQSHNLGDAYVFVFHSGYRNFQMDKLLKGERSITHNKMKE